jgi:hypothetical protein
MGSGVGDADSRSRDLLVARETIERNSAMLPILARA